MSLDKLIKSGLEEVKKIKIGHILLTKDKFSTQQIFQLQLCM